MSQNIEDLLKPLPALAMRGFEDRCGVYPVLRSELYLGPARPSRSNSLNVVSREYLSAAPPLGRHVDSVILQRPDEQVIRSNTPFVVASVQDERFISNEVSIRKNPCDAVRSEIAETAKANEAITIGCDCADPIPASFGLSDLRPETFDETGHIQVCASNIAGRHRSSSKTFVVRATVRRLPRAWPAKSSMTIDAALSAGAADSK